MQTLLATPQTTFYHHLTALGNNDMSELMKDYTEQSEIWAPTGDIVGLKAISSFYTYAFTMFPKGSTRLEIRKMIVKKNKVYIVWDAESSVVSVPFASDSFEIEDGKILWQSTAFQIIQK